MKKVWVALVVAANLLFYATAAGATENTGLKITPWAEWTTTQKLGYGALILGHQLDWAQTRTAMRQPHRFQEMNPLLGSHPSTGRIDKHFFLTSLLFYSLPWVCDVCRQGTPIVGTVFLLNAGRNHFYVGVRARW